MRTTTHHTRVVQVLTFALILSAGCVDVTIRGCNVANMSSNSYGLQYSMVTPSDCPVPIASRGEGKYTGAHVADANGQMRFAQVRVRNSQNQALTANLGTYQQDSQGTYQVTLEVAYPAATGVLWVFPPPGTELAEGFDDYGRFDSGVTWGSWLTGGEVQIRYKTASVNASIAGPDVPLRNTVQSWSVQASGGASPYDVTWYRNGQLVGTGPTYSASTGSAEFGLRAEVQDQTWSIRTTDYWVEVDGVRGAVSGPATVYSSQSGGTWTATGRGGYGPYTYDWYRDRDGEAPLSLGSGNSYSGYPAEGPSTLRVVIRDSAGKVNEASLGVIGIGNPNEYGGCEPVPPAITCIGG